MSVAFCVQDSMEKFSTQTKKDLFFQILFLLNF